MRAFIVDDELIWQHVFREILTGAEFEVVVFPDVVSALKALPDYRPQVILVDRWFGAGQPTGHNLVERARLLAPDVTILMMSSMAEKHQIIDAFRDGVDDFILRPIDRQTLLETIGNAVFRRQAKLNAAPKGRQHSPLSLNVEGRCASWYGQPLHLTPTEFRILQAIFQSSEAVDYADLYLAVRGKRIARSEAYQTLKKHITRLKEKFCAAVPEGKSPIASVRGYGLQFVWPQSET